MPDESQAAIRQGLTLLQGGQPAQAKSRFDAAVRAAPRSPEALTWRGICENQMQDYTAAAADFQAALHLDPALPSAHYNLALSLIRLHKTDAAIDHLNAVLAADPKALQALYNLAVLLERKGSFAAAADRLGVAHQLDPADKGVTLHLLDDRLKLNRSADVSMLLADLVGEATPADTQRLAGVDLLEASRFAEAATLLKLARERDPQAQGVDLLLARAEIGQGHEADALPLLQNARAIVGDEQPYLLGVAYLGIGEVRQATESFESAMTLDPRDARPVYRLGLIAAQQPRGQQEAVRLLRSASALDPANQGYALGLVRVLLATDQAEAARAVLLQMPANAEDGPERHTLTGIALAATHHIAEAVPQLRLAIAADPRQALASNVLGFCLFQQGQYAPAAEAYGRASELDPDRPLYARDAALAYARANQNARALQFAERASAADTASAANHALLGKLYAAANRNADAVRELQRATDLNPDLDAPVYLLARTFLRMGDQQQAQAWSARLTALKQKHEAAFNVQKKSEATPLRSSSLLDGGLIRGDETGAP